MAAAASQVSISTALARARARLAQGASPELDAQLLLAHVLEVGRGALLAGAEQPVGASALANYERAVARRAAGEPLAYITGRREFWSLDLAVTADVLVPRPETELVVERALALLGGAATARVADLGTGSGAIALALASERPGWQVTATDRSPAALAVARRNAAAYALGNVRFLEGAWYAPLGHERFNLIASNPPYVAADDAVLRGAELRHEPLAALASGPGGLEDLEAVIAGAAAHLAADGWLVLEHGAGQPEAVATRLVAHGFRHVRCHADLAGLPRVTEAQGNPSP